MKERIILLVSLARTSFPSLLLLYPEKGTLVIIYNNMTFRPSAQTREAFVSILRLLFNPADGGMQLLRNVDPHGTSRLQIVLGRCCLQTSPWIAVHSPSPDLAGNMCVLWACYKAFPPVPIVSSFLGPNILSSTLFSYSLNLTIPLESGTVNPYEIQTK